MEEQFVLRQRIENSLSGMEYRFGEPMAAHTSFRIGGPAELMVFPKNTEELRRALELSDKLDRNCAILGAGTNVLAPDAGLPGVVICLKGALDGIEREGNCLRVMAGVTLSRAALYAAQQGLSGLEFAHGIPGTLGGAVYMNAGAYGGEIGSLCCQVEVMAMDGSLRTFTQEEMRFSYRHSLLEEQGGIVVSALLELQPGDPVEIQNTMKTLGDKRRSSQPLDYPSAGSAFKRPLGGYAAALIDEAGLKGYRVGDAAISEKHAGFAVNLGNATSEQVQTLLREVSDIVFDKSGIRLEPEVRIW